MKLYTMDFGWAGMIAVVANSKEEAITLMRGNHPDANDDLNKEQIEERDIVPGLVISNLGDL